MSGPDVRRASVLWLAVSILSGLLAVPSSALAESSVQQPRSPNLVPLQVENPPHPFGSWPIDISEVRLDPDRRGRHQDPLLVPGDVTVVSRHRPVTASDGEPVIGELAMVTDGDKSLSSGSFVELGPGSQWIQVDLQTKREIWAVVVWHFPAEHRVYRDVIIQVADDATFMRNVRTLFNNDHDNSSGQGVGRDYEYIGFVNGRIFPAQGAKARHVRCWSRGNTSNDLNHYVEVEVWGR